MGKYNSFKPGEVWLDTNGNRIQAHGGSVIYIDGTYYFYGENKEKTDGKTEYGIGALSATVPRIYTTGKTSVLLFLPIWKMKHHRFIPQPAWTDRI